MKAAGGAPKGRAGEADAGFAATDALVALLILSTTLALVLGGVTTGRHLSEVADQTEEAARLGRAIFTRNAEGSRQVEGRTARFAWRLESQPLGGRAELCAKDLSLRSLKDGRTYRFASAGECG